MIKFRSYMALFVGLGIVGGASAATLIDSRAGISKLVPEDKEAERAANTEQFWNPELEQNAQPAEAPEEDRIIDEDQLDLEDGPVPTTEPPGIPGIAPGRSPKSNELAPSPDAYYELDVDDLQALEVSDAAPQAYGPVPTNPQAGPYGPFQRWSMQGKYLTWPRSIHGKLFFQKPGEGTFVCSATVINRSTIATAAHCVTNGAGGWYTDFRFCPSYLQSGENPQIGCWGWSSVVAPSIYLNTGDIDYDYACLVTATSGTVINDKIGNVTGWAGRAWNFSAQQPIQQFGYPAAYPFDGGVIQQVATTEWYESDRVPGGQVSKYVGSDLTGGSSGGGWFLSWRHPDTEFPDTDGSSTTDPYMASGPYNGPYINGVNSHSRCLDSCFEPPTTTAGTFWQEMGSPPFLNTSAGGESEDVFAECLSHANNNP